MLEYQVLTLLNKKAVRGQTRHMAVELFDVGQVGGSRLPQGRPRRSVFGGLEYIPS